jgi:alpha-galactosidase
MLANQGCSMAGLSTQPSGSGIQSLAEPRGLRAKLEPSGVSFMKKRYHRLGWTRLVVALPCCAVFLIASAAAQQSASGLWLASTTRDDGSVDETYFRWAQNGSHLEGTVLMAGDDLPIRNGVVTDNRLKFEVGPPENTWRCEGTFYSDNLEFTCQGSAPHAKPALVKARRTSAEPFRVRERIEPPSLKELPVNGLAKTPPMGWNSWNHFAGQVDDATVRGIADAMVSNGMRDAGYQYVNIDDTWEGQRDARGMLRPNQKFPDMKALADYVHSKGLKLGIYSSPGPKTCANYEGSYGHEVQDAQMFAAWGIDYLKYDWCSAFRIYKDEEMRAVYQKMGEALQATGRPMVFSLCQYGKQEVWKWGPLAGGNLWRTTDDIFDSWQSMSTIGFSQEALALYAAPGHWNDPDMLEIGNGGLTIEESRTHMSLWSMLAAPLIAGNDLRSVSPDILSVLTNREVISIDQDSLGKAATRALSKGDIEVWTRPLSGGATAIAVFNRGSRSEPFKIPWENLGISRPAKLRDVWNHKDLGVDGSPVEVAAHGVALLRTIP